MNRSMPALSLLAAVLTVGWMSRPLFAFTPGACREDEQKFCGDAKPETRHDCMAQHDADLSKACKDNIAEGKQKMQEKMQEVNTACKQELQQYCANVTPGEGREMACLRSYGNKLSPACKEKLPNRGMRKGMRRHDKGGADHDDNPPPPPDGK